VPVTDIARTIDETHQSDVASAWRAALFCLVVFCVARVAVSLVAVAAVGAHPPDASAITGVSPPASFTMAARPGWHNALDGMQRWDEAWFAWIAADGYGNGEDVRAAFFPAFPAATAATAAVTGTSTPTAATVVSNVAYLCSLIVLFRLTAVELGDREARWSVAFFAAMPTSFFFLAPYSESLFLLATLLVFLWARSDQWSLSACAGVLAGLTRPMAVALTPAVWWIARTASRASRRARIAAVAAPVVGILCYLAWWGVARGDALAPVHAQTYWGRGTAFAPFTVVRGLTFAVLAVVRAVRPDLLVDGALTTCFLVSAVLAVRRIPSAYVAYMWSTLLIPLSFAWAPRPFLSVPRLACVLFPIAWVWVRVLRTRVRLTVAIAVAAVSQLALAAVFMNWGWLF